MKKDILRLLLPPILIDAYTRIRSPIRFSRVDQYWETALRKSSGYLDDRILEKVAQATLKVIQGKAAYERDSVLFLTPAYNWPLLASLFLIASKNNGILNVLDYGGSLGSTYFQHRTLLKTLKQIKWSIVEQDNYVRRAQEIQELSEILFYRNFGECYSAARPDVILFSTVLSYIEKPYDLLAYAQQLNVEYIIVNSTLFIDQDEDILTVQRISEPIYNASYPCWILSRTKFLQCLSERYELLAELPSDETATFHIQGSTAMFTGFFFRKR